MNKPENDFGLGFSDEKLELYSTSNSFFDSGLAPWAAWESENSSFGKCFRDWGFFPSFLPICLSSDHGVHWESRCWPNEIDSPYRVFFTWNKKKKDLMKQLHGKSSYHVTHPWVNYRKRHYPELPEKREGTIVFFAHSNKTTTPAYNDLDSYISDLKALPEKYQPVVICLSFHDIEKGLHKSLRKYGLPLVTAGTTNSRFFVDRFYSMIMQFQFSTSANIGSHTFYLMEAGIPFFLLGPYPEYHIKGSKAVSDGIQNLTDYGDSEDIENFEKLKHSLRSISDEISEEQRAYISHYLGLDAKLSRLKMSGIMWREFFLNMDKVLPLYLKKFMRIINQLGKKTESQ